MVPPRQPMPPLAQKLSLIYTLGSVGVCPESEGRDSKDDAQEQEPMGAGRRYGRGPDPAPGTGSDARLDVTG